MLAAGVLSTSFPSFQLQGSNPKDFLNATQIPARSGMLVWLRRSTLQSNSAILCHSSLLGVLLLLVQGNGASPTEASRSDIESGPEVSKGGRRLWQHSWR